MTVRELMRLESEIALSHARAQRHSGATRPPATSGAHGETATAGADAPRLVGIFGVGRRLFAEVRTGVGAFLFLNGHNLPLGHVADADTYRLKELAGGCVRLERAGQETLLCLPRGEVR